MKHLILAAALIAPLAACATVTRGTTEAFVVESEPSGAAVLTSTGMSCEATPCTFARVRRNAEFTVTISKPGYRTTTHTVTHQTAGGGAAGMAGNVLVGGLIGVAVDASSGATQDLVPNPLRVTLEREEPVATLVSAPAEAVAPAEAAPADAAPAAAPAEVTPAASPSN
ncbi:MAG: PEGA domain-containing protein [Phycisphaerales bacterium]|nr:PEGA domain-containing protein [Hyphomonadaceae bacterium]